MKLLCFVYVNGAWKQATYDEYHAFDGRKEIRPPHYGLIVLQRYLGPLRW